MELTLEDVVRAELVKRTATRQRDRAVLERKRDEAKRKFEIRRIPATEKAYQDAQEALDVAEAELSGLRGADPPARGRAPLSADAPRTAG